MKKIVLLLIMGGAVMHFINIQDTEGADTNVAKTKERIWVASRSVNS